MHRVSSMREIVKEVAHILMEHGVAVEQVGEFPVALCVGQISVDEQISGPDKAGGLHQLFHRDSPVTANSVASG